MLKLMLSGLIVRTKVHYMSELFRNQVYVGLLEILKDDNLYYKSGIDSKYNKLNEYGEHAVLEWFKFVAPKMIEMEKQNLDMHAKQLILQELKK